MELPHIGKNCSFVSCNQLDFLPFQCDGCGKIFCLEHRSREQHNCTAPQAETAEYVGEKSYPCTVAGCDKREVTPIMCNHCQLNFCLSHRLQEDHSCVKLPEKRPDISKTAEHVQEILAQKELKPKPTPTNPKAVQMAAKIALMKLKGKALGDQGVPQTERIYFNVILPLESKKQPIPLFFSKVWTIGRIIDVIADRAPITNNNNTGAEKKLRLFHGDLGTKLQTDKQLCEIMDDEASYLLNGSTVIMETVSEDVDILDNLQAYKR